MKRKKDIVLIGGGGHCKSCIEVIETTESFKIVGVIDVKEKVGEKVLGYSIIGTDNDIPTLVKKIGNVLITLGHIKSSRLRRKLYNEAKRAGAFFPVILSPYAKVSRYVDIGEGTIVMHNAVINAGVTIGNNCIVNNMALIEHDVTIRDFVHISTGAIVNGSCIIQSDSFLGSGSVCNQNVSIGEKIVIGSGAVVINDVINPGIYVGNPVKQINET